MPTEIVKKSRRQRVPDDLRRRAAVSCDRCKLRRAKCVRLAGQQECTNCASKGVKCESTLPRKHRIYGSLESLSLRYRALEALVNGLFPDESTRETDTLYRIAQAKSITMPSVDEQSYCSEIFDQSAPSEGPPGSLKSSQPQPLKSGSTPSSSSIAATGSNINDINNDSIVYNVDDNIGDSSNSSINIDSKASVKDGKPINIHSSSSTIPGSSTPISAPFPKHNKHSLPGTSSITSANEELVPMPHSVSHYAGPSSSLSFAVIIRSMVSRCIAAPRCRQPRPFKRQQHPSSVITNSISSTTGSTCRQPQNNNISINNNNNNNNSAIKDIHSSPNSSVSLQSVAKALEPRYDLPDPESSTATTAAGLDSNQIPHSSASSATSSSSRPTSKSSNSFEKFLPALVEAANEQDIGKLMRVLPPKDVADQLVEAFFEYVHPTYQLFHYPSFYETYISIWKSDGHSLCGVELGWMCCLLLVFIFGADAIEQREKRQSFPEQINVCRYVTLVRSCISKLIQLTTFVNVQALALLQLYEHNVGERNMSWMLLGCACRMAMGLGMHREGTGSTLDIVTRHTRKKVWWTLYTFEILLAIILGRPCSIDDAEINVSLPNEELLENKDNPPNYLEFYIALIRILHRIKWTIYPLPGLPNNVDSVDKTPGVARELLSDLDAWYRSLPPYLLPEWNSMLSRQRRSVLLLHVYYHYGQSLITRPFFLRKVDMDISNLEGSTSDIVSGKAGSGKSSTGRGRNPLLNDITSLSKICMRAAQDSLNLLDQLSTSNLFDGCGWLDGYFLYYSLFLMSLDLLVRPVDHVDTPEEVLHKETIKSMLEMVQRIKIAPTFKIMLHVTTQFAIIIGATREALREKPTSNAKSSSTNKANASSKIQEKRSAENPANSIKSQPVDHVVASSKIQGQNSVSAQQIHDSTEDTHMADVIDIHQNHGLVSHSHLPPPLPPPPHGSQQPSMGVASVSSSQQPMDHPLGTVFPPYVIPGATENEQYTHTTGVEFMPSNQPQLPPWNFFDFTGSTPSMTDSSPASTINSNLSTGPNVGYVDLTVHPYPPAATPLPTNQQQNEFYHHHNHTAHQVTDQHPSTTSSMLHVLSPQHQHNLSMHGLPTHNIHASGTHAHSGVAGDIMMFMPTIIPVADTFSTGMLRDIDRFGNSFVRDELNTTNP